MAFSVYILRMKDGRLYVGHSSDPLRRHAEHHVGKGCRTTDIFGAGDIIHVEEYPDRVAASRRECQIKGGTRAKKLAWQRGTFRPSMNCLPVAGSDTIVFLAKCGTIFSMPRSP